MIPVYLLRTCSKSFEKIMNDQISGAGGGGAGKPTSFDLVKIQAKCVKSMKI